MSKRKVRKGYSNMSFTKEQRDRLGKQMGLDGPLPPPNLQGNYEDTCVACYKGTDTGIALAGPIEELVAGLARLGVPPEFAFGGIREWVMSMIGKKAHLTEDGHLVLPIQVCSGCAERGGFKATLALPGQPVPVYTRQRAA